MKRFTPFVCSLLLVSSAWAVDTRLHGDYREYATTGTATTMSETFDPPNHVKLLEIRVGLFGTASDTVTCMLDSHLGVNYDTQVTAFTASADGTTTTGLKQLDPPVILNKDDALVLTSGDFSTTYTLQILYEILN